MIWFSGVLIGAIALVTVAGAYVAYQVLDQGVDRYFLGSLVDSKFYWEPSDEFD